jgi:hypothetical protein
MVVRHGQRARRFGWILLGVMAVGLALGVGVRDARADGAWLDAPLHNWNQPGMSVPRPPAGADVGNPVCLATVRPPETDEDSAVAAAGWRLVGAYQGGYGAKVITATTGFDGMCRPLGYQVFVFYHQTFIGTISPEAMNSRTDGSESQVFLFGGQPGAAPQINANFLRYTESDALCCPSRISHVTYEIQFTTVGWVLAPTNVSTEPTQ